MWETPDSGGGRERGGAADGRCLPLSPRAASGGPEVTVRPAVSATRRYWASGEARAPPTGRRRAAAAPACPASPFVAVEPSARARERPTAAGGACPGVE